MATPFSGNYYYKGGNGGRSAVVGFEDGSNRVLRINFDTGDIGATSIAISVEAGCIQNQGGADLTKIPFYVTESDTSHANANEEDGYAVTGYITGSSNKAYSGSANVVLKANTTYYVWFFPPNKTFGWSYWYRNTDWYKSFYELSGTSKFGLSISAGAGSSITVNRTSSDAGLLTGNLTDGAEIYAGDKLKIAFTPDANYAIKTRTVNNTTFTSGNTHTVSGDVAVVSTAQVLASDVGASDANIGSNSAITVTRYNSEYYHTLEYSFGGLTGYITSSGGTSSSAVKFRDTSVSFAVPTSFYAQIPNAKTGICTITCKTYLSESSTTQLGESTSCTFIVTAAENMCKPIVSGAVVDTNATTKALTGDDTTLIRYKSTAQCTIVATANNSATVSSKLINDVIPTNDVRTISAVDSNSFVFEAVDSRGYASSYTVKPSMVSYTMLTCNPIIYRPTPTGNKISLTVSGNIYRGSFGAYSNTLKLQYRYRQRGGAYGSWQEISNTLLTMGVSSYRSTNEIELQSYATTDTNGETVYPGFDYNMDYEFQIRATDGAESYILSTVDKYVTVNRGVPVFDWGENDFNINVALLLSNVNILDIMYPVGAVYMHSGDTLPTAVSDVGTWSSIDTEISGVYAWKRTA